MNNTDNNPEENPQTQENQSQSEAPISNQPTSNPSEQPIQSNLTQDEKLFGAIAYLNLGCLLTLAMKPKSQFCQFHAKQGVVLIIIFFLNLFVLALIPLIGWLIFFAIVVISLYGAFNSYQGKTWKLPYISEYAGKIDLTKLDSIPFPTINQQSTETKKEEKPVESESKKKQDVTQEEK